MDPYAISQVAFPAASALVKAAASSLLQGSRPTPDWVPVQTLLEGLRRAADGAVRVSIGGSGCTGWLITERLVVVPNYVLGDDPGQMITCALPAEPDELAADVAFRADPGGEGPAQVALLRLPQAFPQRPLELAIASVVRNEPVLLLHHPQMATELHVSQGRVLSETPERLRHDAPSTTGSGGAPLIRPATGEVLGLHLGIAEDGIAVGITPLLAALRVSPAWPEIAAAHRLADIRVAGTASASVEPGPPQPDARQESEAAPSDALLRAAIAWTIDPEQLAPDHADQIKVWIDDPEDSVWSLQAEDRRRLIESAGSLDTLRRLHAPAADPGPDTATITRIVAGPPYSLDEVPDDQLPYWLQAVTWFDQLVPELPRPAEVHRTLSARRIRSRLRDSTAPRLWGRDGELEQLRTWFGADAPPPMVVTGIGGIGKSALVARFALDLPAETILLWLDFDRADLAPDNAVSVVASLVEQLRVQDERFGEPEVDEWTWSSVASSLSAALSGRGALMVLDGFEVAQHTQRHEELWDVLEEVLGRSDTRVLISGRAPVPGLRLLGQDAETLPLTGVADAAARQWLADNGVVDPAVVQRVLRAARGMPLLLKLTLRLLKAGGDLPSTLDRLPQELVSGYLYRRILNRVGTPRMRRIARDALVLRRLTPDVVAEVLNDRIPDGLDATQVFTLLSRELALVEAAGLEPTTSGPGGWLRMRPEVRVATLRLLEIEDRDRTREIDRRAAEWYAALDVGSTNAPLDPVVAAAERVYHLARLGDLKALEAAWVDGCEEYLTDAVDEVPEEFSAARTWLQRKVAGVARHERSLQQGAVAWEDEVLLRIRSALGRGLERAVPSFLREDEARSPESPLLIFDAWTLRQDGRVEDARELLEHRPAPGRIGWERTIVAARTAALAGDVDEADRLLAGIDLSARFIDPDHALAVTAARIRFAVDLPAEARLIEVAHRHRNPSELSRILVPWDLVQPAPRWLLGRGEHHSFPPIPEDERESYQLAESMDSARRHATRAESVGPHSVLPPPDADGLPADAIPSGVPHNDLPADAALAVLGRRLAELSVRRWRLVVHSTFLTDVRRAIESRNTFTNQVRLSLAGTAAAFWSSGLQYRDDMPLLEVARRAADTAGITRAAPEAEERLGRMRSALETVADVHPKLALRFLLRSFSDGPFLWGSLPIDGWPDGSNGALLFALGPDPLEELERRVLGLPELKAK